MATTSTLGLAREALVTVLNTGELAGKVHYAWPGPQLTKGAHEAVWVDEIPEWTQTIPNIKAGRKQRQETYTLELVLWVAKPDAVGQAGAQATFERGLALIAVAENALADDVQLAGDDEPAETAIQWVVLSDRTIALIPHDKGWGAMATLRFEGNARLT